MTRDRDDAPEPPTLHLSAEELRAYLAQARSREVDTSMATRLFVHPRHALREPDDIPQPLLAPPRVLRPPPGLEPRTELARPLPALFSDVDANSLADATRTCFASPAYVARPRLGERSDEPAHRDGPPGNAASDPGTQRLLAGELGQPTVRARDSERPRFPSLVRHLHARLRGLSSRPRARLIALTCLAAGALVVALFTVGQSDCVTGVHTAEEPLSLAAAGSPLPAAGSSARASEAPPAVPAVPSPTALPAPVAAREPAVPGVIELVPMAPTATPPRRALDLLLRGESRDALDAYRALAREPAAAPVFAHVVKLLELEAQRCAERGDGACR